jgi:hypothetical protein
MMFNIAKLVMDQSDLCLDHALPFKSYFQVSKVECRQVPVENCRQVPRLVLFFACFPVKQIFSGSLVRFSQVQTVLRAGGVLS